MDGTIALSDKFVLQYPDGKLVALDPVTGLYPYPTLNPNSVQFFRDYNAADTYRQMFSKYDLKILKITFLAETI